MLDWTYISSTGGKLLIEFLVMYSTYLLSRVEKSVRNRSLRGYTTVHCKVSAYHVTYVEKF